MRFANLREIKIADLKNEVKDLEVKLQLVDNVLDK